MVNTIEQVLLDEKVNFFSPRCLTDAIGHKIENMDQGRQVLRDDIAGMERCGVVLAINDFLLPENTQLALVRNLLPKPDDQILPIALPDSGTVWEMGWAHARNKPVALYCEQEPKRVNLMLACSAIGIAHRVRGLRAWLRGEPLAEYQGALQ